MRTRRKFLLGCSTIAAASIAAPLFSRGALFESPDASFEDLAFAQWAAQVNSTFRVQASDGQTCELRLIEAVRDAERPQHGRRPSIDANYEKFSLIFAGQPHERLSQDIFKFDHERLGRFDLFIVPLFSRNPETAKYAAIFNRPRKNQTSS